MTLDELLATIGRLNAQSEALAALGALLRIRGEGLQADPDVERRLDDVARQLGVDLAALGDEQLAIAAGMARMLLLQSAELVSDPARPPGWVLDDPGVLQGAGATSAAIPQVMQHLVPQLDGLAARLERPGATFLDIGSGVALMSVAACRVWPQVRVIAVDRWEPALRLARENIARAGLEERIELRACAAEQLDLDGVVDLAWLPGPFLRSESVGPVVAATLRALVPGGWAAFGLYAGPPDDLARVLVALRTVRSGGAVTDAATAAGILRDAGFADVQVPVRDWNAPVELVFGRRPGG